jgi:hypothetical protein
MTKNTNQETIYSVQNTQIKERGQVKLHTKAI